MKKCTKCNKTLSLKDFHRCKRSPKGVRAECKSCRKKYAANLFKSKKIDHYIVYYLPEEHYVGITNHPKDRMSNHRRGGKNINGWRVLYATECRTDARHHENLFHSVLMCNGISY